MNKIVQNQGSVFSSLKEMWVFVYLIASMIYTTYLFFLNVLPKTYDIYVNELAAGDMLLLNEVFIMAVFCLVITVFNYFIVIPWIEKQPV